MTFVTTVVRTIGENSNGNSSILKKPDETSEYVPREPTRRMVLQTCVLVISACLFGVGLGCVRGSSSSTFEFLVGYLLELSLSFDNIFAFVSIFNHFQVTPDGQERVLLWGIWTAVLLRGFFIYLGMSIIEEFRWIVLPLSCILIVSSYAICQDFRNKQVDTNHAQEKISRSWIVRFAKRFIGATDRFDGNKFFRRDSEIDSEYSVRDRDLLEIETVQLQRYRHPHPKKGKLRPTPLLICLVAIELTDIAFAGDSITAVLAVSNDVVVIYFSNIFAVALLRVIYIFVNRLMADFRFLKPAVALLLLLVGVKMVVEYFQPDTFDISTSLFITVMILGIATFLSTQKRKEEQNSSTKNNVLVKNGSSVLLFITMLLFLAGRIRPDFKINSLKSPQFITKVSKPTIYRFDTMDRDEKDEGLLAIPYHWHKIWESAGWTPVFLNLKKNRGSRLHSQLLAKLSTAHLEKHQSRHIEKYIAMAAAGGGWVAHSDVFPLHPFSKQGLNLPNEGRLSIYDGAVPCLMSGSAEEWMDMAEILVSGAIQYSPTTDHPWSEMIGLRIASSEKSFIVQGEVLHDNVHQAIEGNTAGECDQMNRKRAIQFSFDDTGKKMTDDPSEIVTSWLGQWYKLCRNSLNFSD